MLPVRMGRSGGGSRVLSGRVRLQVRCLVLTEKLNENAGLV